MSYSNLFCCLFSVSLLLYCPILLWTTLNNRGTCTIDFIAYNIQPWAYFSALTLFTYVIPLSVIVVCYAKILLYLRANAMIWGSIPANGNRSMRAKRKTTKLVVISVLFFAICWLPRHSVIMTITIFGRSASPAMIKKCIELVRWSSILVFINSAFNPFLYPLAGTGFINHLPVCCTRGSSSSATKSQTDQERTRIDSVM